MTKVESWNKHNKGLTRGYTPSLEAFKGFLLTTCFWEQELLVRDKTPFRVSPKLCYGLGSGNSILCLNALMFIWNGYVQVCLMLYSLKIIKLHNCIINFVSPLEAVPECPFQSAFSEPYKLWCWRRLLRVPWTGRRWNQSILKEIGPEYSLEGLTLKLKCKARRTALWKGHSGTASSGLTKFIIQLCSFIIFRE